MVWVNSIGMRSPRMRIADISRITRRLGAMAKGRLTREQSQAGAHGIPRVRIVQPRVLPWHHSRLAVAAGRRTLTSSIRRHLSELRATRPNLLLANPVAIRYLDGLSDGPLGYLRLDDYAHLPGVDPKLVQSAEAELFDRADVVFATARALLPTGISARTAYLPQGVDAQHFASAPIQPPKSRVLGFFGLIAPWVDIALVAAVARTNPTWTLELIGPVQCDTALIDGFDNVRLLPAVPYAELPTAIAGWAAAWIPFVRSQLTEAVNPLKLREYLAAGLPTASTPLPETQSLGALVERVEDAEAVTRWLEGPVSSDSAEEREQRRASVAEHSWSNRAATLRAEFEVPR